MPAKKEALTQAEQSERFIKTARELGVSEDGALFERAFGVVSKHKPEHQVSAPLTKASATEKMRRPAAKKKNAGAKG